MEVSATEDIDYSNTSINVSIESKAKPLCYKIELLDDNEDERLETFIVVIKIDEISRGNATVIITDDDGKYPSVSVYFVFKNYRNKIAAAWFLIS